MRIRSVAALAALAVLAAWIGACAGSAGGKYTRKADTALTAKAARDKMVKELFVYLERKDDRGIAHMLSSTLGYGGVWFPDTQCRRKFAGAGTIPEAGIDQFASCMVNLPLQLSARQHPYPDVAVFTYEPGIEVEALFDPADGGHLIWIGYVSRRDLEDSLPTVSQEALLAQRNEVAPLVLDEATQKQIADSVRGEPAYAWFKVCVDATGAVTGVHPRLTSSLAAQDAFEPWVRSWSFKPFKLGEQPSPVCAVVLVDEPVGAATDVPRPLPIPPEHAGNVLVTPAALGELVAGTRAIEPEAGTVAEARESPERELAALALYCIDEAGAVDTVVLMRPSRFPKYDEQLTDGMKQWRFAPLVRKGAPVRACSHAWFGPAKP